MSSVVVHDAHVVEVVGLNVSKADAPLVVDADAVLTGPIGDQSFQVAPRAASDIMEKDGLVDHLELSFRTSLNVRRKPT